MNLTDSQTVSITFLGLGILVTLLTSFLKTLNWSPKTTHSLVALLTLVGAYVSAYFQRNGTTDLEDVTKHFTYIYAASQFVYIYALRNTALNNWLVKFNLVNNKN
jgi:hypothetical protein